jgi:hypothetical protein
VIFTLGKRYEYPYRLLYDRKVWPNYDEILDNLPHASLYVHNPASRHCGPGRSSFSLVARQLERLQPRQRAIWEAVRDQLHAPALAEHLATKLVVRRRPLVPFATLCRDTKGHFIDVHPDWDRKIITVQFYLPRDESLRDTGTDIYDESKRWVRRLEFLPNTAYCFARSETSYHGLREIKNDIVRDSLMLTYYGEPFDEY